MSSQSDEGPVYYREILKTAYLKLIPNETTGSKLLPLSNKKPPLKAQWTVFCVHNGRSPYLEQYASATSGGAARHQPTWRASLQHARHVTAAVRGTARGEYDFLVDTDSGPLRLLAPDWQSQQEWVAALRAKLLELQIVPRGENVYCAPPPPHRPRAAARDPTSPLPPTPPVPPDRVPGIELTPIRTTQPEPPPAPEPSPSNSEHSPHNSEPSPQNSEPSPLNSEPSPLNSEPFPLNSEQPDQNIDISHWDDNEPSTSQDNQDPKPKSVTKICGQNICLDDSILKRNVESTDSDEEFFAEIDRISEAVGSDPFDYKVDYKQRLVVNESETNQEDGQSSSDQPSNVTVIEVSNKPPHSASPLLGAHPHARVFNFDLQKEGEFVNIVNTEHVQSLPTDNGYGTVFKESDYGHLSLTTTVSLTGNVKDDVTAVKNDSIYERLCLASTSNKNNSPLPLRKLKQSDKVRKSSLPNLDMNNDSTYEYLFPNNNKNTVTVNEVNSNVTATANVNITATNTNSSVNVNSEVRPSCNGVRVTASDVNVPVTNSSVHVLSNSVSVNSDVSARVRANVERSHSQNAYDRSPGRDLIRPHHSPKRDGKSEKASEGAVKPMWKRGLTELSLLSRLRSITARRQDVAIQDHTHDQDRSVVSPKAVHRSRGETRADCSRRRTSSLTNAPAAGPVRPALVPLRARQAAALRAELRRGAASPATLLARDPPVLADYNDQVWIARWGEAGARWGGRAGDRLAGLSGRAGDRLAGLSGRAGDQLAGLSGRAGDRLAGLSGRAGDQLAGLSGRAGDRLAGLSGRAGPRAARARQLIKASPSHLVDILFHRVPLAKIYVINKRDLEPIGIKLDNECTITAVEAGSPAARSGIPPAGKWAVTEVNNRPINLLKGSEEEMNRISIHGTEVLLLLQPAALVKKLRAALRASRPLLALR